MKQLIDQNISFRIQAKISELSPDIQHVRDLGLIDAVDAEIFEFARQKGFDAILTLDEDFQNLVIEHEIPPKIIWLRTGNCSISEQAQSLLKSSTAIQEFMGDKGYDVLEIYR